MFDMNDIIRFNNKILYPKDIENECWIFQSSGVPKGYRVIYWNKKQDYAHRIMYMLYHKLSSIPKNMYICHKCDNPPCVNPNHLFLGTPTDNVMDMKQKGRENHLNGENIKTSKLTEDNIREMLSGKFKTTKEICDYFNIGRQIVLHILNGNNWKHITKEFDLKSIRDTILYQGGKGENHPGSKLTEQDIIDILELKYTSYKDIQNNLKITKSIISNILNGQLWTEVTKNYDLDNIRQKLINKSKGSTHHSSKITEQDVIDILTFKYNTILDASNALGIDRNAIYPILKGKSWKQITKNYDLQKISSKLLQR